MAKELRGKCASACGAGESDLISSYAETKESPFSTACFLESVSRDSILRKGKWTTEEEDYATKIISLFNRGLLPIGAGTTLRSYLSDKLNWYALDHSVSVTSMKSHFLVVCQQMQDTSTAFTTKFNLLLKTSKRIQYCHCIIYQSFTSSKLT